MRSACETAAQNGAKFNEAVVTAMAALESAWGTSYLAREANNILGIKAGTSWKGETVVLPTREVKDGKEVVVKSAFRKYPSWSHCIMDFSEIISTRLHFKKALDYLNDPPFFLLALLPRKNKPGWATDPLYFEKVVRVAKEIESLGGPKWVK